jgi:hypothetical protein
MDYWQEISGAGRDGRKAKALYFVTWPAGSGEEDFLKFSVYFYSFVIISPWRGSIPFI